LKAISGARAPMTVAPALGSFDLGFQPFVLPLADILQVGSFGTGCRRFVQIDRDAEFASDTLTQSLGNGNTLFHACAAERDKGNDIRCADAWMRACVLIEVDQFGSGLDGAESGFFYSGGRPGKGQHGAVVVEVGGAVEQFDFAH
jgi:hypothetical protein